MSASAFAGVIGGPLAGTIMNGMNGVNGWSGWQWVLLIEGIPSVIAGIVTYFYLTDRPEEAQWLTARERDARARRPGARQPGARRPRARACSPR